MRRKEERLQGDKMERGEKKKGEREGWCWWDVGLELVATLL